MLNILWKELKDKKWLFIIYTIIISAEIIRSVCAACRVTEVTGFDTLYTARANEATDMRSLI